MKGVLSMGENKKEYKNENKKSKLSPVLITILMIGFGILLIVKPDLAVKILVIILGIVLLAGGAIFVLGWFFGGKDGGKGKGNAPKGSHFKHLKNGFAKRLIVVAMNQYPSNKRNTYCEKWSCE